MDSLLCNDALMLGWQTFSSSHATLLAYVKALVDQLALKGHSWHQKMCVDLSIPRGLSGQVHLHNVKWGSLHFSQDQSVQCRANKVMIDH